MKTVILCGGMGTRLAEETSIVPKPMVRVGGRPILEHILNIYSHFGHNEFVLALGHKGEIIKEFFINYHSLTSDMSVNLATGKTAFTNSIAKTWNVHLIDTGEKSLTATRLLRLKSHLVNDGTFMLTYGDGLSNVDLDALLKFHRQHGKLVTVTAVTPLARFGAMVLEGSQVTRFCEKPEESQDWINAGFFVMEPGVFDYLQFGDLALEGKPLESLAKDGQLMAYQHEGFWQCMDTKREQLLLEELWAKGDAPWEFTKRSQVHQGDFGKKFEKKKRLSVA